MTEEVDDIKVVPKDTDELRSRFTVKIKHYTYSVTVSKDYYQRLTGGEIPPDELVKKSFQFLLEREPASAILPEFDLSLINHYFPEYESTIVS